jgi:GT2 family glycosyltransferase
MTAHILIGIPAFRGADFITETLRSIAAQDYGNFQALISVDGNDVETAAACSPYLSDPRFALKMQDQRLGWDGNINWLMSQTETEFFCYWQQDDVATADYISCLMQGTRTHPSAVCYFSDIQWTGQWTHRSVSPSVTGFALNRALSIFETMNGIPMRGLIRKSAIERTGPIRRTEFESAFEEIVWLGKLARAGNLHRVEGPTYFKKMHGESVHGKWLKKDRAWKRAVWLKFGLGMLDVIWPLVSKEERLTAVSATLDRLCVPRPGRYLLYDGARIAFAADFLLKALEQFPVQEIVDALPGSKADLRLAGGIAGDLLDQAIALAHRRSREAIAEPSEFGFGAGEPGVDLLLEGWSAAEEWGIWSDGAQAQIRLPVGSRNGIWKVELTFQAFGKVGSTVEVAADLQATSGAWNWLCPANQVLQKELTVNSHGTDVVLQFTKGDLTSPAEIGISDDCRQLGVGLIRLELKRPD